MTSVIFSGGTVPISLRLGGRTQASFPSSVSFRSPAIRFRRGLYCPSTRGLVLRPRAGASTSTIVFAFAFPLSLLLVTIFTSIKVADKLDRDFLEELALNQSLMEVPDGDDEAKDEDGSISIKEPALPRSRNRPKREA